MFTQSGFVVFFTTSAMSSSDSNASAKRKSAPASLNAFNRVTTSSRPLTAKVSVRD